MVGDRARRIALRRSRASDVAGVSTPNATFCSAATSAACGGIHTTCAASTVYAHTTGVVASIAGASGSAASSADPIAPAQAWRHRDRPARQSPVGAPTAVRASGAPVAVLLAQPCLELPCTPRPSRARASTRAVVRWFPRQPPHGYTTSFPTRAAINCSLRGLGGWSHDRSTSVSLRRRYSYS